MKKFIYAFSLVFAILFLSACVTHRKKGETSKIGKFYHDVTAKYNGYYNAKVLLNESIVKLNTQQQDNYSKILDMYEYVAATEAQAVAGELDNAIKKASVVISLHRPSHWVDDSYLLIGKSQYVKKDYESAQETFEYLIDEFSPEKMEKNNKSVKSSKKSKKGKALIGKVSNNKKNTPDSKGKSVVSVTKKKKTTSKSKKKPTTKKDKGEVVQQASTQVPKQDALAAKPDESTEAETDDIEALGKPKNYFFKHRPCFQEAQLWLARTFIEREKYDDAETILLKLQRDPETFTDIRRQLAVVQSYFFVKQKSYERAVPFLQKAVTYTNNKAEKARYAFILAQIHQLGGRQQMAYENFDKAMKYSNNYDMDFSANLNLTENAWLTGKITPEEAEKRFQSMIKDYKNRDYLDRIYATLGEVALKNKQPDAAAAYFKQSLKNNTNHKEQRADIFYTLAKLYFGSDKFVEARNYFDSTAAVLPQTDPRYAEVNRYSANLAEIAEATTTINETDSLLKISAMSVKDRILFANKIKDEREKEATRKKNVELNSANVTQEPKSTNKGKSAFFAYNSKALQQGRRDFEKTWGNAATRKLEDNWRRSTKRDNGFGAGAATAKNENATSKSDEEVINDILKDVPKNPETIAAANKKVEESLFSLGKMLRDRLNANQKSVETLEKLLQRYPNTPSESDAFCTLQKAYSDLNNKAKADVYADKVIQKYPTSTCAEYLKNPAAITSLQAAASEVAKDYDAAYALFTQNKQKEALELLTKAEIKYGDRNTMKPKYALLKAMCMGSTAGKEAYMKALNELIAQYPATQEQSRAKEIVRLLGGGASEVGSVGAAVNTSDIPENPVMGPFKMENETLHYGIVIMKNDNKLSDVKGSISDYNRTNFKIDGLRVSNVFMGSDTGAPVIVIRKFTNKDAAMRYYQAVTKNSDKFIAIAGVNYETFVVTQDNYRELLNTQQLDLYRQFFTKFYLSK
jgi:tetratricopeptide (TPR) repeat protein